MLSAREYLQQLGNINAAIGQDMRRLEELRAHALSGGGAIRYDTDKVQGTPEDRMSAEVIDIVDLDALIRRKAGRYVEAREHIIDQIRGMHCELYTRILYDVYVLGMGLKDTAADIGRSYNNTIEKHADALALFEKTYSPLDYII